MVVKLFTDQTTLLQSKPYTVYKQQQTIMTANAEVKTVTAVTPTYKVNKTEISMPTVCMPYKRSK